ncbi:glycosyltransferase family 39 protein [Glomus cerebriforme]|uniref:Dolichyl-phosphate-mannose--protein mannosyltransferase n=1 Tax=Glomus cerebriforme TaxID=658196 RepID=A0A397TJD8_9GLOM|nr:glycosyltransferase family 39 protein [Glomus cerebriforme]
MSDQNQVRQRQIGYTESEIPIQEEFDDRKKEAIFKKRESNPDVVSRIILAVLTLLSFVTRFYSIEYPAQVVYVAIFISFNWSTSFDEVHFGKFASYYLKRMYFFDVHPPLAKMMFAGMGYLLGYDGHFEFDNIGDDYISNNIPYVGLRALPATLGALFVPLMYMIMIESGYPIITAIFAAALVLFDNALICQTQLILLDSMLIFFMLCTFYSYVRFYKLRLREFSNEWWIWLVTSGVSLGLTISVKMVGLFTVMTIGVAVLIDLWNLLDIKRGLTMTQFRKHFAARAIGLIVVPISVYLFFFYIHFIILNTSGPGDAFMSPAFQETLRGNVMNLQSFEIRYNDTITLKHKDTSVFLHSHVEHYPLRYEDGRISSQGQQVTGYPHEDDNNQWRIKPAENFFNTSRPENDTIKHGDFILLEHIKTNSHLLTHDVASPLMPTNQEFTTFPADDKSRYNETVFQVYIHDGDSNTVWKTKSSFVRIIHYDTKVALWTHDAALPEWGFKQQEVNGNKNNIEKSNFWFANEIIGKNVTEPSEQKEPRKIPFLLKYFELQRLMISHNSGLTKPHPYSSGPINWPFLIRGISFWTNNDDREQIYLLGNPFNWWLTVASMAVLVGVLLADVISRRRGIKPISDPVRNRLYNSGCFFFLAWLFHYIPFYLMGRSLFLHHYLPALVCSYMVASVVFNFMFINSVNYPISISGAGAVVDYISFIVAITIICISFGVYLYLSPLTYGTPGLDPSGIYNRRWLDTWDLHFQPKKGEI